MAELSLCRIYDSSLAVLKEISASPSGTQYSVLIDSANPTSPHGGCGCSRQSGRLHTIAACHSLWHNQTWSSLSILLIYPGLVPHPDLHSIPARRNLLAASTLKSRCFRTTFLLKNWHRNMSVPSGLSNPGGTKFPSLESITGPLLLGTLLSTALWGITCVQTYDYFTTPNEDRPWHKSIVVLLCILDTFDTIVNTHFLYHYLIKNFMNPSAFLSTTWSASCRSLLIVLSSFIVCTMFVRRIYLLSGKSIILPSWIMVLSLAHLVVGTLITVKSIVGINSEVLPNITHLLYVAFSLGVMLDVSITLGLYWFLHSLKTGIRKTDSLVKVLMLYIVATGFLVVVDATVGLILFIVMPNNLVYLGFYLLLSKLYINAFLASLNARENLRQDQTDVAITLSRLGYQPGRQTTVATDDDGSCHRSDSAIQTPIDDKVKNSSNV